MADVTIDGVGPEIKADLVSGCRQDHSSGRAGKDAAGAGRPGAACVVSRISTLIQEVKVAVRQRRRRTVFTPTAVLTLAIGLGANAVAFRLRGPAYSDSGRMMRF